MANLHSGRKLLTGQLPTATPNSDRCGYCKRKFVHCERVKWLSASGSDTSVVCEERFRSKVGVPLEIMEFIQDHKETGDVRCPCCSNRDPLKVRFLTFPERGALGPATLRCPTTGREWTEEKLYNPNHLVEMGVFWEHVSEVQS